MRLTRLSLQRSHSDGTLCIYILYLRERAVHGMAQAILVQVLPVQSVAKKQSMPKKSRLYLFFGADDRTCLTASTQYCLFYCYAYPCERAVHGMAQAILVQVLPVHAAQ